MNSASNTGFSSTKTPCELSMISQIKNGCLDSQFHASIPYLSISSPPVADQKLSLRPLSFGGTTACSNSNHLQQEIGNHPEGLATGLNRIKFIKQEFNRERIDPSYLESRGQAPSWLKEDSLTRQFILDMMNRNGALSSFSRPDFDLLERCKKDKAVFRRTSLSDVRGLVKQFAEDRFGSFLLQRKLDTCSSNEKKMMFDELFNNLSGLMDHEFGNYVVQKCLTVGTEEQQKTLVEEMTDNIYRYACLSRASRVIQTALGTVNEGLRKFLIYEIQFYTIALMEDANGNHVVQKAMNIDENYKQFVINLLLDNPDAVIKFSIEQYTSRIVQTVLKIASYPETHKMIMHICKGFEELATNKIGNYVIQEAIDISSKDDVLMIADLLAANIFKYASQKYSSNVIEKCLRFTDANGILIKQACFTFEGSLPTICIMMIDPFANYVVQRMFDNSTTEQLKLLVSTVRPHLQIVKQCEQGKQIMYKLAKHFHN